MALEPDGIAVVDLDEFPGVGLVQPVLGRFDLLTALETLAEQPVFVTDAISEGRALQRRQRFHEARRQPPQPAVAKRRIGFVVQDFLLVEAQHPQRLIHGLFQPQVDDRIPQHPPDQEFHRQIADPLGPLVAGGAERIDPGARHQVAHGKADGHPPVKGRREFRPPPLAVGQVVKDLVVQGLGRRNGVQIKPRSGGKSWGNAMAARIAPKG